MPIITRPEPLDSSYIPDNLRHREDQIESIRGLVIDPLIAGNSSSAIIFGPPGVGKTATCKLLARETSRVSMVYESFVTFGSIKLLLQDVLLKTGRVTLPSGTSLDYVFKALKQSQSKSGRKIVLVIDESMNAFRDENGIYNLIRAKELHSVEMSTIFVSVDNPLLYLMSGVKRMQYNPVIIKFNRYSVTELESILYNRASIALSADSYSMDILNFIAETSASSGSARVAIELLQKSAYLASHRSSSTIKVEDVRAAMAFINPYVTESKLAQLDFQDLLILLSVCISLGAKAETDVRGIRSSLDMVCEEYSVNKIGIQPLYSGLKELERIGLIEGHIVSAGPGTGTSKVVRLNDIPVSVLREKVESLIQRLS